MNVFGSYNLGKICPHNPSQGGSGSGKSGAQGDEAIQKRMELNNLRQKAVGLRDEMYEKIKEKTNDLAEDQKNRVKDLMNTVKDTAKLSNTDLKGLIELHRVQRGGHSKVHL